MICLALFTATARASGGAPLPGALPLVAGAGGLAAAFLVGWTLSRPLANLYYRSVLAMLAVFGTAVIGALAVPAHVLAGRTGLAVLALACVVAIFLARRRLLPRKA